MDFLAEANVAGQALLRLVSRGNAIIAELLRLSQNIPRTFLNVPPPYENIVFDFRYLKNQDLYETRIEDSSDLIGLDQDLKQSHLEILKRFYNLFEGIFKYHKDLHQYLSELDDGVFIQLTLETVLDNEDGKQLMCEAVYLWSVMLTLLDMLIEGPVRERVIISYLRYKGHNELPLIDDVCNLCRSTGYLPSMGIGKKPSGYPEEYMARFPLQAHAISMILGRLRSDDIYNQIRAYPMPPHRSTALATQAAMIYMILYLAPNVLHRENAVMREIVDKYFPDNWVMSFYLGFTVDLSVVWDGYKAAKAAIANTIAMSNVNLVSDRYWKSVPALMNELAGYLTEGVLIEDYILDNMTKLLNCVRNCNVTLRWLMLHIISQQKKIREAVLNAAGSNQQHLDTVLMLLLNTAQFEFILKRIVQNILDQKNTRWEAHRKESSDRMHELGNYFSGEQPLVKIKANKHLQKWFHDIAAQIAGLDYSDVTVAGRKMQQLKQALEEVEQFHQIEQSLQVRQFLVDTRKYLEQMIRLCNIAPGVLVILDLVSDLSFAWDILRDPALYIPILQQRIKKEPALVLKLRSTLVKLSSILNLPLVRINQANSSDLLSVSAYYSDELIAYVRKVLEIIPQSVFEILNAVIELQTQKIKEIPTRVEKEQLKDFSQLEDRYKLAEATHDISVFTEGILAMETTLVGIDKLIPYKMLEEGIRKELVNRLSYALDRTLTFKTDKIDELLGKVKTLGSILDGYCRSFQYIQDYIRMQGLRVWQEEFMRIINFNVEQECSSFLTKKGEWESRYQSREVEIPTFPRTDDQSVNFIGRLARALLVQTDYKTTVYLHSMSAWYDLNGKEIIGPQVFKTLLEGISVFGMTGLDQLYAFMLVKELQTLVRLFDKFGGDKATAKIIGDIIVQLVPPTTIPLDTAKLYESTIQATKKLHPNLMSICCRVGQIQLLRNHIAELLDLNCKSDSNILYSTLKVVNSSLVKDIQAHYKDPQNLPYPDTQNPLLPELTKYLESSGLADPLDKIYVTAKSTEMLPFLLFTFVAATSPKYRYDPTLNIISPKETGKNRADGTTLVVGVITLLNQFHRHHTEQFVAFCTQFIRASLNFMSFGKSSVDFPPEATSMLLFLEAFVQNGGISRTEIEAHLPPFILDSFKHC